MRSLEAPLAGHDASSIDPWFRRQLDEIDKFRTFMSLSASTDSSAEPRLPPEILRQAKVFGFSDRQIAEAIGSDEGSVHRSRVALGIRPVFAEVDTCAGEFKAATPYYYSCYAPDTSGASGESAADGGRKRKIMVLGGGPNRIGQGIEFD